jgi:hypothetical protein
MYVPPGWKCVLFTFRLDNAFSIDGMVIFFEDETKITMPAMRSRFEANGNHAPGRKITMPDTRSCFGGDGHVVVGRPAPQRRRNFGAFA